MVNVKTLISKRAEEKVALPHLDIQGCCQTGQVKQQMEDLNGCTCVQQKWEKVHKLRDKRWAVPRQELQETSKKRCTVPSTPLRSPDSSHTVTIRDGKGKVTSEEQKQRRLGVQ